MVQKEFSRLLQFEIVEKPERLIKALIRAVLSLRTGTYLKVEEQLLPVQNPVFASTRPERLVVRL